MRPLRMARDLRLLPGRQVGIELLERLRRLGLEPRDLLADGDRVAARAHGAQLLDLGLELGHRLFEIEIAAHRVPAAGLSEDLTWTAAMSQASGFIPRVQRLNPGHRPADAGRAPGS